MLHTKCIHPQLLGALGKLGHGSRILISDGGYPHATHSHENAEFVWLNLSQGMLTVSDVLEVLKVTVPIEEAYVMAPMDGRDLPVHEEYRKAIPDVPFEKIKQFDFYEKTKERETGLIIATGDMRNYANLMLKVGYIKQPEG